MCSLNSHWRNWNWNQRAWIGPFNWLKSSEQMEWLAHTTWVSMHQIDLHLWEETECFAFRTYLLSPSCNESVSRHRLFGNSKFQNCGLENIGHKVLMWHSPTFLFLPHRCQWRPCPHHPNVKMTQFWVTQLLTSCVFLAGVIWMNQNKKLCSRGTFLETDSPMALLGFVCHMTPN